MGKIKRARQKFHASTLKKDGKSIPNNETNQQMEEEITEIPNTNAPKTNIFAGLNINLSSVNQNVPDFDTKSILSSKSLGFQLKKREKRKIRHEMFMKKLDVVTSAQKEAVNAKKRRETVVVGDMKPLEDALPTLELLMKESFDAKNEAAKKTEKPRSSISFKARQKTMLAEMDMFKKIANNDVFKSNPTGTILAHLRYKAERQEL